MAGKKSPDGVYWMADNGSVRCLYDDCPAICSIRRLICEIGSNSLRGLYKTLYARVFNRPENKDHYYDAVVSFLMQIRSKDAVPNDTDFVLSLKERNLYRKNALCKYLLTSIENQGKEQINTETLTIEHIMPQNKNLSSDWQKMLGEDVWQEVKDRYLHTLGNLTLTGYNSELGDKPFDEKKKLLDESITHVTLLYSDVKDKDIWNAQTIEARAERLADIVLKMFSIEAPKNSIDFSDPRYKEYTAAEPKNAKNKTPEYYDLIGERVSVDSFAQMLRSVALKLYDMDSSVIEQLAEQNSSLPGWQSTVFSFDSNKLHNPIQFKPDSDIYMSSGYSAENILWIIRGLLIKHDLDIEEDFSYSARVTISAASNNLDNLQIAKDWCALRMAAGDLIFDPINSSGDYVRFTTLKMNCLIPESSGKLSPWKTKNFYFYEIYENRGRIGIQMALYCKGISEEMRKACVSLASILGVDLFIQKVLTYRKELNNGCAEELDIS